MGIPTARFSLLTGGGKIPDHDNEDGHSDGNHDHVDEDDSHGGLSCSWGDLLLNSPGGSVLICKHLKKLHQSVGSLLICKRITSPLLYVPKMCTLCLFMDCATC